jgi:aryl-alcohol dehydrogenase-like predicted oxidoreductase
MTKRRLGRGGPVVGRLGLGLAALGRPGYINVGHGEDVGDVRAPEALETRTHEVLDAAWQAGVRYFDAARSYGRAEQFLASWLARRQVAPGDAVVGSKWGYAYTAGWRVEADVHEVKDHGLPMLSRQWSESRELLGPHLGLYQVHSLTADSPLLDDPAVLDALATLRADAGVRIGVSLSGPEQGEVLRRLLPIERDGRPLFDVVQATWNLLEPSAGSALAEARADGRGVIVKEALANGRLTRRNREHDFSARRGLLEGQATRLCTTPEAVALAAALAQPFADLVLSGAATVAQLHENLAALDVIWDDEAAERLAPLPEPASLYWAKRKALPWR